MEDSLPRVLLLMVQKSGDHQMRLLVSPIIYMVLCPSKRWLVGCLGYLLPSTVVTQVILTISSFAKFHHSNNPPLPQMAPTTSQPFSRLKLVKKPEVLLEMPADTVVEAADPGSEETACWEGRSVGTLRYATATWNNPPIHGGFCGKWNHMLGGGVFKYLFMFIPIFWANDPIWRAYFSKGLVQPPTRYVLETLLKKWAGNRLGEPGLDNWALPNRGSWLSGNWHYLKDNDPIGGTHFELPWLWGRAIDLFVVPLHDFLEMMWRRDWFQKQQS